MDINLKKQTWYYDKRDFKKTPSIADGLRFTTEQRYRRDGARFIIKVGTKMGLRYDTMATGVVYFHRFYMFHSFRTFPRFVTACCCLFLAGKVEETPKKCKDIIKSARIFLTDTQFAQFGDDPKEEVMTLERILLQTIKFDLQVDHPYGYLLRYAKSLRGDKSKLQQLVQMAWTFVNDSLCTTLCLQWEPEIIAIALMYLASKLSKFEVTDWQGKVTKHSRWWDMFVDDMSIELLEDVCHQVLDLYSTPVPTSPQDSPPASPASPRTTDLHGAQTDSPSQGQSSEASPPSKPLKEPSPGQPISSVISVQAASNVSAVSSLVGMPIPRLEPREHPSSLLPSSASHSVVQSVSTKAHIISSSSQHSSSISGPSMQQEVGSSGAPLLSSQPHSYSYKSMPEDAYRPYQSIAVPPPPPPPLQNQSYGPPSGYQPSYQDSRAPPSNVPPAPSPYSSYSQQSYYSNSSGSQSMHSSGGHSHPYGDSYGGGHHQYHHPPGPPPPPPPHYPHLLSDPHSGQSNYRYHGPPQLEGQGPTGIPSVRITGRF